jgi:hypothetical protein
MVKNSTVLYVEKATYRGCEPFSGYFELVFPATEPRQYQNKLCAEVYCAWHNKKPLTCFPHIQILGNYKIIQNYSGEVVDNLA